MPQPSRLKGSPHRKARFSWLAMSALSPPLVIFSGRQTFLAPMAPALLPARNQDPLALVVLGQPKASMQQHDEHVHIVRLEASADADAPGIAFDRYLAGVVAVELVGGLCQRLLVEH